MKKSIFVLAGLMISLVASAQKLKESEVPSLVKEAFQKSYKDPKDVEWEKEDANYEVEFETGKTDQSVVYDTNGNVLETEIEINVAELPSAAKDYMAKNYKEAKIKEVKKITQSAGAINYEVEIKGKDIVFDANGGFVKEVVDSKDKKD